jgi:hypothetical protein
MSDDPLEKAKIATEVIGGLIQAAGDNPEVKQAGSELGKAALTLAKSVNVVLLPLAAINFGYDKAKEYFSNKDKFEKDFSEKTSKILEDDIVDPKPSIAGPAMQGLAFSHEEPDLKEMYLNLLSNSMDRKKAASVHPAFVDVIKQLSGSEVSILNHFIKGVPNHPIVRIKLNQYKFGDERFIIIKSHVMNTFETATHQPVVLENIDSYVENWIRLGIYSVDYERHIADTAAYNWIYERPEYKAVSAGEQESVDFEKGIMGLTAFGREFARAIS